MTITLPRAGAEVLQQSKEALGPVFRKMLEEWVAEHNANTVGVASVQTAGFIWPFAGPTPPTGWLVCDGASVLRADYPALFAAIGTNWGSADGAHFNVPDMRGRAPVGAGTGAGLSARTLGQSIGAEQHQHVTEIGWDGLLGLYMKTDVAGAGAVPASGSIVENPVNLVKQTVPATSSGAVRLANTRMDSSMQPSAVVQWLVKT